MFVLNAPLLMITFYFRRRVCENSVIKIRPCSNTTPIHAYFWEGTTYQCDIVSVGARHRFALIITLIKFVRYNFFWTKYSHRSVQTIAISRPAKNTFGQILSWIQLRNNMVMLWNVNIHSLVHYITFDSYTFPSGALGTGIAESTCKKESDYYSLAKI